MTDIMDEKGNTYKQPKVSGEKDHIGSGRKPLRKFINRTEFDKNGMEPSDNTVTNLWALAVAIWSIGGSIGAFIGGWLANTLGRKKGNLTNSVFGIVSTAIFFASKRTETYELFIVGRFLIGINCGVYTTICPMYISEISTVSIRGAVGVLNTIGIVVGILVGQILGFRVIFGNDDLWDILIAFQAIPCILQLIFLSMSPESPRYLMISKNNEKASINSLVSLRGHVDINEELEEIKEEMRSQTQKVSVVQLFTRPSLRMPLLIGIVLHVSFSLCGAIAAVYYSTSLFEDIGLSNTVASYTTASLGVTGLIFRLIIVPLVEIAGRRTLQLIGVGGLVGTGIVLTAAFVIRHDVEAFKYVAVVSMLCYIAFFAVGPGTISWLVVPELVSHEARPALLSVCVLLNWLFNGATGYAFPFIQRGLKDYSFTPFIAFMILTFIFLYITLPETKGKTFEEVSAIWEKKGTKISLVEATDQHHDTGRKISAEYTNASYTENEVYK